MVSWRAAAWASASLLLTGTVACGANDTGSTNVDGQTTDTTSADGVVTTDATQLFQDSVDDGATGTGTSPDGDAAALEDALPPGSICTAPSECDSGWCVPTAGGTVCASICIDECPVGTRCVPATGESTDPVFLCVPDVVPPQPDATTGDDTATDTTTPPDATVEGDAVIDDTTTAPDATVESDTGTVDDGGGVTDNDQDDDGIPDDIDNLPCLAIYMVIYNQGVTSGSVALNGTEVVGTNAFPTTEPIVIWLNPTTGVNTLDLGSKVGGSPSDSLSISIFDTNGNLYFATVIVRESGQPKTYSFTFNVDVTCP